MDSWVSLKSVGIKDSQSRLEERKKNSEATFLKTKQSIIIFKEIFLKSKGAPEADSQFPPTSQHDFADDAERWYTLQLWLKGVYLTTHFMVGRKVRFSNPWCSKNSSRCCLGWSAAAPAAVGLESRKNDAVLMPGQGPWSGMRSISFLKNFQHHKIHNVGGDD